MQSKRHPQSANSKKQQLRLWLAGVSNAWLRKFGQERIGKQLTHQSHADRENQ